VLVEHTESETTMHLRPLGRTGVQVTLLCLGCMMFGRRASPDDPNAYGNSRRHNIEQCEASLPRLQTDYIDL
jgi:aryl-alcohol dehydrogenase-like predicted oxidoreductase